MDDTFFSLDTSLPPRSISPLDATVATVSDAEDSRIPSSVYELFETSLEEDNNKETSMSMFTTASNKPMVASKRLKLLDDADFDIAKIKKGLPKTHFIPPPRSTHKLRIYPNRYKKEPKSAELETQWDDEPFDEEILSPKKPLLTTIPSQPISEEEEECYEKKMLSTQAVNLINKYNRPKIVDTDEFDRSMSQDDDDDEEEDTCPPSPVLVRRSQRPQNDPIISAGSITGFSNGFGASIDINQSAIEAAKDKLSSKESKSSFSSGLGNAIVISHSATNAAKVKITETTKIGFSNGFGSAVAIDQSAISAAKGKLLTDSNKSGFSTGFGSAVEIDSSAVNAAKSKLSDTPIKTGFSSGFGDTVQILPNTGRGKLSMPKQETSSFTPVKPMPSFNQAAPAPKPQEPRNSAHEAIFRQLYRIDLDQCTNREYYGKSEWHEFGRELGILEPVKLPPSLLGFSLAPRVSFNDRCAERGMLSSLNEHLKFEVDMSRKTVTTTGAAAASTSTPIAKTKTNRPMKCIDLSPIRESSIFTTSEWRVLSERERASRELVGRRSSAPHDKRLRPGCLYRDKKGRRKMQLEECKRGKSGMSKTDLSILSYYTKDEILAKQVMCGDSGHLHCDELGVITIEHFQLALHTSTVSPQLIKSLTRDWVANHVALIRQKLAAYDRQFDAFASPCHTPLNILSQLRLRADRELIDGARSHFCRLSSGDINPESGFVAFLAGEKTISDGWYVAEIKTDHVLAKRLAKCRFGAKLLIHNAKYQPGHKEADSPVETPLRLELHANSVCPIKSSKMVKLGAFSRTPILPLDCLVPGGGMTTRIRLTILREYPTMFFIDDQNTQYGSKRRRAITKRQFEATQQKRQEQSSRDYSTFIEEAEKEEKSDFDPDLKNISTKQFQSLTYGCDIYEALHSSNDMEYLGGVMSNGQRVQLEKHKDKLSRQRLQEYRKESGDSGINKTPYRVFRASCDLASMASCMVQMKALGDELEIKVGAVVEIRRPRIVASLGDMIVSFGKETAMEKLDHKATQVTVRPLIPCGLDKIESRNPLFPNELDLVGIIVDCSERAVHIANTRHMHVKIEADIPWADAMLHNIIKCGQLVAFQSLKLDGIRVKFNQKTSEVFTTEKSATMSPVLTKLMVQTAKQIKSKPALINTIVETFKSRSNSNQNMTFNVRPRIENKPIAACHNQTMPALQSSSISAKVQSKLDFLDKQSTYWGSLK